MKSFTAVATFMVGLLVPLSLAGGGSSFKDCGGSSGIAARINTADGLALVNATVLNNFPTPLSNPFALNARSSQEFGSGSAQFCIENDFIFENTHIAMHDLAQGAFDVLQQCCQNSLSCDGGSSTVFGDSGLSTIVRVKNVGDVCQGELQDGGFLEGLADITLDALADLFDAALEVLAAA